MLDTGQSKLQKFWHTTQSSKICGQYPGFITKNSGNCSVILFDYFPQSVIDGSSDSEAGKNIHDHLAQVGEPLQFGLMEGTAEEFLGKRGFSKVCNVTGEDHKKAYFHGVNKDRMVCSLMSFVHATVE